MSPKHYVLRLLSSSAELSFQCLKYLSANNYTFLYNRSKPMFLEYTYLYSFLVAFKYNIKVKPKRVFLLKFNLYRKC